MSVDERDTSRCFLCRGKLGKQTRRLPHVDELQKHVATQAKICTGCFLGLRVGVALVSVTDESHELQGRAFRNWLERTKAGQKNVPYPNLQERSGLTVTVSDEYLMDCVAAVAAHMGAPQTAGMLYVHCARYRWMYVPDKVIEQDEKLMAAIPEEAERVWREQIMELTG